MLKQVRVPQHLEKRKENAGIAEDSDTHVRFAPLEMRLVSSAVKKDTLLQFVEKQIHLEGFLLQWKNRCYSV